MRFIDSVWWVKDNVGSLEMPRHGGCRLKENVIKIVTKI